VTVERGIESCGVVCNGSYKPRYFYILEVLDLTSETPIF